MKIKSTTAAPGTLAMYAHSKLDGHYLRVIVSKDEIVFESSLGTRLYLPDRIFNECCRLPVGVYLGELWVSGKPASSVKTAIKHEWPELMLTFFGVEECEATYFDEMIEYAPLEMVHAFFDFYELNFAPYEILSTVPIALTKEHLDDYKMRARLAGLEGWVFKTGNLTGWAKLKVDNTIDLVVIGSNDGKGKYAGLVGSLQCAAFLPNGMQTAVADVGGFDDDTRQTLTLNRDNNTLSGIVIEVKYQNVDSKGRLRHPRFVRVRDDKLGFQCLIEQDAELMKHHGT